MRDDERFEVERAFDLLPHIVGSGWAVVWFRLNGIKNPTRIQYREKTVEYFKMLDVLFDSYPHDLTDIKKYIKFRRESEIKNILSGSNKEVEKRYDRYIDYG